LFRLPERIKARTVEGGWPVTTSDHRHALQDRIDRAMAPSAEITADRRNGFRCAPAVREHRDGRSKHGFPSKEPNLERGAGAQVVDPPGTLAVRPSKWLSRKPSKTRGKPSKTVRDKPESPQISMRAKHPVKVHGRP
jgi:hypothetical protein